MNHQKILSLILSVAIVLAVFCTSASAQNSEDARLARLAGLAKVWGTVKYFHPYLASREIDWDKALIETIKVTPTIRGLVAGRDEILDEAVRFLQKKGSE